MTAAKQQLAGDLKELYEKAAPDVKKKTAQESFKTPTCNSPEVKETFTKFLKHIKAAALKVAPNMAAELDPWQLNLVNIRQRDYDEVNNRRSCAGDFVWKNIPDFNLGVM